jgi:hypothetical protein
MDPSLYHRIMHVDLPCGKLDCVRQCCNSLPYLISLFRQIQPEDEEMFIRAICGCPTHATPPALPATPQVPQRTDNCVTAIAEWSRQYEAEFNAIQTILIMANGMQLTGELGVIVAALLVALEQLEDARTADQTTLEAMVDGLCASLQTIDDAKDRAASTIPDALSPLRDALEYIDVSRLLTLGCCAPRPQTPALPPAEQPSVPSRYTPANVRDEMVATASSADARQRAAIEAGRRQEEARLRAEERRGQS